MIKRPGRQPTIGEKLSCYYSNIVNSFHVSKREVIVHHITEDTPKCLQLEVEFRYDNIITFARIIVNNH